MRHIIIGDVHGCHSELISLIEDLKLQDEDKLYFIGDLIDRGPDSVGVVKYVRSLSARYSTILILGNHEEKLLRFNHHKNMKDEFLHKMQDTDNLKFLEQNLNSLDIEFLSSSYINYNLTDYNICLLHGGISENNNINLNSNFQYSYDLFKIQKGIDLLLKTRYLDSSGNFVALGKEDENSVFWADKYNGYFGKIIFGHHAIISNKPKEYTNAINVDTGCVFGGWLSCCIIYDGNITYKSIKASKAYYKRN